MKYFISCGELSGDRIASLIAQELLKEKNTSIKSIGGPHLQHAGSINVIDIQELQLMGWQEVIARLPHLAHLLDRTKKEIKKWNPDIIILVDNASFNLRLAKWCKKNNYKTAYLIPPKVWASRPGRIEQLKSNCDLVLSLFPFEKEYLEKRGVKTKYLGHPLVDEISNYNFDPQFRSTHALDEKPILSLLPGSRLQEIKYVLPSMAAAACSFKNIFQLCISAAPSIDENEIKKRIPKNQQSDFKFIKGSSLDLLKHSHLSLITSGTATLEAALLKIPHLCCYRMHPVNYQIARRIITADYISLPNLLLSKPLVPEMIQCHCSRKALIAGIKQLNTESQRSIQIKGYSQIEKMLSGSNAISSLAQTIKSIP